MEKIRKFLKIYGQVQGVGFRYFVMHLDDPGKPGFVSCDKPYFGNEEVI